MGVPANELRPRGALGLFDAAIRLCARTGGAWALTLPAGAAVSWAALHLLDSAGEGRPVLLPALWMTLAWLLRGVCQGATCHHLEGLLLGDAAPSAWQSLRQALRRLPSLVVAAAYLPVFNLVSIVGSFGLGYFLLCSHLAAFAAVMKGRGHPLALYQTCARLLGPAKSNTAMVRVLFWVALLVGLNLHVGTNVLVYLGRKLLGLDLTYAQRFASLDNGAWVAVVAVVTFVLFEPLRAAVATLLLIDGRVRQEGLDLLAQVEQLPRRPSTQLKAGAGMVAAAALLCWPGPAGAEKTPPSSPVERLRSAALACEVSAPELAFEGALEPAEQAALRRLADEVEAHAFTWDDCDAVEARLEQALPLLARTVRALPEEGHTARQRAAEILARPEFLPRAEPRVEAKDAGEEDEDSFGARLRRWWRKLLESLDADEPAASRGSRSAFGGTGSANVLVVVLLAAVALLVGVLLYLAFRGRRPGDAAVEVEQAAIGADKAQGDHALSRPPEGWALLADELAAQGRFREAVRSLYLALLSRLHGAGAIDYDPALSNWDYCRRFRGKREWLPGFRELTHLFDFAWYGISPVGAEGYTAFRALAKPLLAKDPDLRPAQGALPRA